MIISHRNRFILFPDPLGSCKWVSSVLSPWSDQLISDSDADDTRTPFFHGMSPGEAELAFDLKGLPFRDYTRIAVVQNPYTKMALLYDRIARTDRIWRMRRRAGLGIPGYARWLRSTRPHGTGAGNSNSPRWRKFGSWSNKAWCGDRISHTIRAEAAAADLAPILKELRISPALIARVNQPSDVPLATRYDMRSRAIINTRYAWDLAQHGYCSHDLRLVA